jgi:pimeloyl-ACP methyl ester carboxylesterase
MPEHTTRAADAAQLSYDCRGTGSPLLFLHGLTFDRSTWEPIIVQLAGRFTCIAVDLPGHGGSDGPPRALGDVALAVHDLLDELGIEAPVVVGHSMGGVLASNFAAHHRVRGLVLVDQAHYVLPFAAMIHQLEPVLRSAGFRAAFEPIRRSIGVEQLPEPQRTSILASQRIDQDLILGYWDELLRTTPDQVQARTDRELNAILVPVLAVFGQAIDATTREHLLAHLPSAEIEEWPGLGHMVHLMEPARFARLLADFATKCFVTSH